MERPVTSIEEDFLTRAPSRDEWLKRQKAQGIQSARHYSAAIRLLVEPRAAANIVSGAPGAGQDATLLGVASNFSASAQAFHQDSELRKACASFQRFLLYSFCHLLLEEDPASEDAVDQILQWTTPQQRMRRECLDGAFWIHRAIVRMHKTYNWSIESATQLFFLSASTTLPLQGLQLKRISQSHCPSPALPR